MSEKTLTRMDLSEAVFREVGLSPAERPRALAVTPRPVKKCPFNHGAF